MRHDSGLRGSAFWLNEARVNQRMAADAAEDARKFVDRGNATAARALQHRSAHLYANARDAVDMASRGAL